MKRARSPVTSIVGVEELASGVTLMASSRSRTGQAAAVAICGSYQDDVVLNPARDQAVLVADFGAI